MPEMILYSFSLHLKQTHMKAFKLSCLIAILSLLPYLGKAQVTPTRSMQKTIDKLRSDPDFASTEVPEKWKNESAVILAKSFDYKIKLDAWGFLDERIYFHKRIKLMDSLAVRAFYPENILEYSIDFSVTTALFGMDIIKQDGTVNSLPVQTIVTTKDSVRLKAGDFSIIAVSKLTHEITLPELEIGDIVDYFIICTSSSNLATEWKLEPEEYQMTFWLFRGKNFSMVDPLHRTHPVFYKLTECYPIVKQKFCIFPSTWMRLNSRSVNGAPMLFPVEKKGDTYYSLVTENIEKDNDKLWIYPYRNYPAVKFQTFYFSNKELNRIDFLKYFVKSPKQNNYYLDLLHSDELVKEIYATSSLFDDDLVLHTTQSLNSNFKKNTPADTIVKYAYNYMCKYNTRYDRDLFGRNIFILSLSKVLASKKIPHDLVITIPNHVSDIKDLILPSELAYLIRVKGSPDYLIGDNYPTTSYKSVHSEYQGNNAFAIGNPKTVSDPKIERIVIPVDKPDVNVQTCSINIMMSRNNPETLQIELQKSLKGYFNESELEYEITEVKPSDEIISYKYSNPPMVLKKTSEQLKAEYEPVLRDKYESKFSDGEDFKFDSFSIKKIEKPGKPVELEYGFNFESRALVEKADSDYLVSIGRLIASKPELTKEVLDRSADLFIPSACTDRYNITFEIPEGYKVNGIDNLNSRITNPSGGFISKSEIQGNNLIITTEQYFNHNYEKAADWPRLVELLEASFNFTQRQILLEKQ
jgi:hypothetical protein